jgi:hypothetical protein
MAGQIYKRGERTWQVRIFMGRDANGKQIFHRKTIHGTKKDADRYLTAARREMDLGTFVEPTAMSVNEYLDSWLCDAPAHASHAAHPTVTPGCWKECAVIPYLGYFAEAKKCIK